jgi:hypothetical protein
MEIIDFKSSETVNAHLEAKRKLNSQDYALEYAGDRTLRDLQVGKREDYVQGQKVVRAEKMIINLQKKIVRTAVSFLCGVAPDITASDPENLAGIEVLRILKEMRYNAKFLRFSEGVMAETISAFIFTIKKVGEGPEQEINARVMTSKNGIYTPHYNEYGDLIAFYWEFSIGSIQHLYVFTDTEIHKFAGDGEYKYKESEVHGFGVIPVVFLEQEAPEWWDVKEMIDRLEMIVSKLSGSNNFFAFPILKLKGAVNPTDGKPLIDVSADGKNILLGYAEKNGQIIQSEAEFLKRDAAVDSIKTEVEFLTEFIHSISQTPDLSFNNVKGIGNVSGVALELMFMDAINKSVWKQADFKTVIERSINVILSGMNTTNPSLKSEDLSFDIEFNLSLPKDYLEEIKMLTEATAGKPILSQKSAIKISPLTTDFNEELENLAEELAKDSTGGESFNFPTR